VSEPATFAFPLPPCVTPIKPSRSPDHPYRKDSPAPPEPGRVALDPGRAAMALDASHAAGRDSRLAGSRGNGGQTGHRSHGHGSVANLGAGRRAARLGREWDRLEHIANYDALVRQMLGVPALPWGQQARVFGHQTLRDNVALLDDELLRQINARIAAAGRAVFAKKDGAPWRRWRSRWTPTCWKPMCISPPT